MGLYISMNIPGSNHSESAINNAITSLASQIASEKLNGYLAEEPALDITFMLSGKHEKPDFSGMRMGGYTPENKTLYFETAVPEHITQSDKAPDYVAVVLQDMIDNAEMFFSDTDFSDTDISDSEVNFNAQLWRAVLEKYINPQIKHLALTHDYHYLFRRYKGRLDE